VAQQRATLVKYVKQAAQRAWVVLSWYRCTRGEMGVIKERAERSHVRALST